MRLRWDIFASESSSVCVGSLKALVRVVRHEADAPLGLPASLGALLSPSRYTIRLYVLRAEHLVPGDTCGTSDAYLKINCGEFAASTRARCKDRVTDADFFEVRLSHPTLMFQQLARSGGSWRLSRATTSEALTPKAPSFLSRPPPTLLAHPVDAVI